MSKVWKLWAINFLGTEKVTACCKIYEIYWEFHILPLKYIYTKKYIVQILEGAHQSEVQMNIFLFPW